MKGISYTELKMSKSTLKKNKEIYKTTKLLPSFVNWTSVAVCELRWNIWSPFQKDHTVVGT